MIELKNITKAYGENVILQNVNTTINQGDVVAVIGPSGCGKSTLLNCINVLEPATSGQVIFNGVDLMDKKTDLQKQRQRIGMVFQSYNLFGHMTVLENAMHPQIHLLGRDRQTACDNAMKYLKLVGMAERKFHYPSQLSGGQKQRAAIARTLAMDPEVLLMDEPTSALDPSMVGEVEYVIQKLAQEGRTMVIVTHSMSLARKVSNRIFYMDEKGIFEDGPTEQIFTAPKKEKTRRFIQKLKTEELLIRSADYDFIDHMQRIQNFGAKMFFDPKRIMRAQLLYEECVAVILPTQQPNPDIRVVFEYQEETDSLSMTVYHPGDKQLDDLSDDPIREKLIENIKKEILLKEICEQ